MSERIVLVLNGGAALGAYQCGVYKTLVRWFDRSSLHNMIVVGASSGAVNGFLIAVHHGDGDAGAGALESFWRGVAQPSLPFFPFPHPYWARVNATLTGFGFGNPAIFWPIPGGTLAAILAYPYGAPFDNAPMALTLASHSEGYASAEGEPHLLVRAVDMADAQAVWFDSRREPITPSAIAASAAIPLLFRPHWHEGRAYWDGDVWPQGVLPDILPQLLRDTQGEDLHVIVVELFTSEQQFPVGAGAGLHQFRTTFLARRSDQDAAAAATTPAVRLTRVRRLAQPYERASIELFDWAPERISALIEQGERDAEQSLGEEAADGAASLRMAAR
jgi:NTE family protein